MSSSHTCNAFVATCIDFRFQKYIETWLAKNIGERQYDRVAWAGGVFDQEGVLNQLAISKRLHDVKRVVFLNHEECGAYGASGTPAKHAQDLKTTAKRVKEMYPNVQVEGYYIHLDGLFEKIV